jgi:hypothetical protein
MSRTSILLKVAGIGSNLPDITIDQQEIKFKAIQAFEFLKLDKRFKI